MTDIITVLVTGVGGGVGQSVMKGLNLASDQRDDIKYRIVGVDADPTSSGLFRAEAGYTVPMADAPNYVDEIVKIAREEAVDVVIPGSDPEVSTIAESKAAIADRGETKVLVSSPETVEISRDKLRTYEFLTNQGFEAPATVLAQNAKKLIETVGFPLVVKPRYGSASNDLFVVTDATELVFALEHGSPESIVQEYLIPTAWGEKEFSAADLERQIDEFSTEVIVDSSGDIVHSLANWRKMEDGVPSVAEIKPYDGVREACEAVVEKLDALGPVNLQARVTDRGVSFFELNPRFTGSTAVRCTAGFNGPDVMVRHLVRGDSLDISDLAFENLVEIRYKDEIYLSEEQFEKAVEKGYVEGGGTKRDYY